MSTSKHKRAPILLWPLPSILPLPYWVIYPQFLNASYGQSGICSEVPGLCGGNIIKVVKDVKGEEWGWHQANFTLGTRMARSKPGLLPRNTDQSALSPHQRRRKKKGGKRTPNYANPQDEYILILLEYKLMPWLSDWTFFGKNESWTELLLPFLHEVPSVRLPDKQSESEQTFFLSFFLSGGSTQLIIGGSVRPRQQIAVGSK